MLLFAVVQKMGHNINYRKITNNVSACDTYTVLTHNAGLAALGLIADSKLQQAICLRLYLMRDGLLVCFGVINHGKKGCYLYTC